MPSLWYIPREADLVFDPTKIVVVNNVLKLIRRDANGEPSPLNTDLVEPEGEVIFPNKVITGLQELFSLRGVGYAPTGSAVLVQLSNDGGTTWYRWDGANWVNDGNWNSIGQLNSGLPFFFRGGGASATPQVRFRLKLQATPDRLGTPWIGMVELGLEYRYNPATDIAQTLIRLLKQARPLVQYEQTLKAIPVGGQLPVLHSFPVSEVIGVWNITTDPGRQTNLATGPFGDAYIMINTGGLTVGDVLDIEWRGRIEKVSMHADEEYVKANMPLYTVRIDTSEDDLPESQIGSKEVLINEALGIARIREWPQTELMTVRIYSVAKYEQQMRAMVDAVHDLFRVKGRSLGNPIVSLATAQEFPIVEYNYFELSSDEREGWHEALVEFQVQGKAWRSPYIQRPIATSIEIGVISGNIIENPPMMT